MLAKAGQVALGVVRRGSAQGTKKGYDVMAEEFHGTVGSPELDSIVDQSIQVTHRTIKIDDVGGFRALDLAQLNGAVLALDWVVGRTHHIWGSAVMVAPGVALTARHVVDAMREEGFLAQEGGYLLALGFHAHGVVFWNPDSFTPVGAGDVAVLTLVRATASPSPSAGMPIPVSAATMAMRSPGEGERISMFGFTATDAVFEDGKTVALSLLGGVGPVLEIYPERRDQRLGGPSACVAATTVGGMSGGGAFDEQGRLIGLISAGIGDDTSFISFVWPCMFTPLQTAWPPGLVQERTTLHELGRRGLCSVVGLDLVESHTSDDGAPCVSLRSEQSIRIIGPKDV